MSARSEHSIPSPEGTALVLAISPSTADHDRLREILAEGNGKLYRDSGCRQALVLLRGLTVPMFLCEREHADCNGGDLLKATAELPAPHLQKKRRLPAAQRYRWKLLSHGPAGRRDLNVNGLGGSAARECQHSGPTEQLVKSRPFVTLRTSTVKLLGDTYEKPRENVSACPSHLVLRNSRHTAVECSDC
jgi:hypothetical protein